MSPHDRARRPSRSEALAQLPAAYSLALRLHDEHLPLRVMAERLSVEPEAVGPMLAVAEAKLAALLRRATAPADGTE